MSPRVSGSSAGPAPATTVYADPFSLPLGSLSVSGSDPNKQLVVREQSEQAQSMEIVSQSSEGRPLSSRSIHCAAKAPVVTSEETIELAMDHLIDLATNSRALKAERDLLTKDNTLLKSEIEQLKATLDTEWTTRTTSVAANVNTLFQKLDLLKQTITQADEQTRANFQAWQSGCAWVNAENVRRTMARMWSWGSLAAPPLLVPSAEPCAVLGVNATVYSYCTNSITPLIQEVKNLQATLPNLPAQARKEAQEAWKPSEAGPSEPPSEERALVPLAGEAPVSGEFAEVVHKKEIQFEKQNAPVQAEILLLKKETQQLNAEKTMLQEVDAKAIAIYHKLIQQHLTLPTARKAEDPIHINYNLLYQSNCPTITPKLNEIMTLIEEILK